MQTYEVRIAPEVISFLQDIPEILLRENYKSTYDAAVAYTDDILDFVSKLPTAIHYTLPTASEHHFSRYGTPLYYSFFKRPSSPQTTWYIFFTKTSDKILVKHICNNWTEGQYIR